MSLGLYQQRGNITTVHALLPAEWPALIADVAFAGYLCDQCLSFGSSLHVTKPAEFELRNLRGGGGVLQ